MCGIAGFLGNAPNEAGLDRMLAALHHRGPDEAGTYVDDKVAMGTARLAIIDVPDGQQPMRDDETGVVACMNGEIFNYIELREELESHGDCGFRTHSDTEVLLKLYLRYGDDCLSKLNGQYAISIWDPRSQKLMIARDRFGICPLFYHHSQSRFYFASEIKSLLTHREIPRRLNLQAIDQIFTFWTAVSGHTALQEIYELMPGKKLTIRPGGSPQIEDYWSWPFPEQQEKLDLSYDEAVEGFRERLRDAVKIRLRADGEVGSYLSGGIDSSALVALASQKNSRPLRTYSIGFADESYDETPFQQQVADRYDSIHQPVRCHADDVQGEFERVIWHTETPLFRTAPSPMRRLSREVRNDAYKVVLTGEGADEILLGYDLFREVKVRRFWSRQPDSKSRPELLKKLYAYLPQFSNSRYAALAVQSFRGTLESDSPFYSHMIRWNNNAANKVYFSPDVKQQTAEFDALTTLEQSLPSEFAGVGDMDRAQYLELTTLLRGYLLSSQGDRMLMSNSVEGRFPYLDHTLVEFANSLPQNYKLRGLNDKRLLRDAMEDLLPPQIRRRPKFAYQAPELRAFIEVNGAPSPLVDQYLSHAAIQETGVFDPAQAERLLKKACNSDLTRLGTRDNMAFVQMLSTQIFYHKFILEDPSRQADEFLPKMNVTTRLTNLERV